MNQSVITPMGAAGAPPAPPPSPLLPATLAAPQSVIHMGFDTVQGFEAMQRAAKLLANSTLVPVHYRAVVEKGYGANKKEEQNPNGISNCVVALNMASRMGADPLMVMQNLHVIEGKPGWSSQWIIAAINQCGRFSPLRFEFTPEGEEVPLTYSEVSWVNNSKTEKSVTVKYKKRSCRAWATELKTGQRIDGPWISMDMAAAEGWIGKKGSKWQTMPEVMMTYRGASLFGRIYCPELLMGFQSKEEVEDILDAEVVSLAPAPATVPEAPKSMEDLKARLAGEAGVALDVEPEPPAPTSQAEPEIGAAPVAAAQEPVPAAPAPPPEPAKAAEAPRVEPMGKMHRESLRKHGRLYEIPEEVIAKAEAAMDAAGKDERRKFFEDMTAGDKGVFDLFYPTKAPAGEGLGLDGAK